MPRLLEGIRILDLSTIWAAPLGTRWLADMGAEVIKVQELPKLTPLIQRRLELMRDDPKAGGAPGIGALPPMASIKGISGYVLQLEANKRSISLDFESPKGRELLKRLVAKSDILVDNHRPVVLERSELDYQHLRKVKPELIMLTVTAMGATGPERNYSGFGATIDGLCGLAFHTGYPGEDTPVRSGINYADPVAGMLVGGALMLALIHRHRTGEGQYIDVSLREIATNLGEMFMEYSMNKRFYPRLGNREPGFAPHGVYRTRGEDRWIAIAVNTEAEWQALCGVIGDPTWAHDRRFLDMQSRWHNHDALDALLNARTQAYDAMALAERLQAAGIAATPVLTIPEILRTPQHEARGYWQTVTHPDIGAYHYYGPAWRLPATPAEVRTPPPLYGEANREVYQGLLGLSDAEYAALLEEKVVSESPLPEIPEALAPRPA